MAAILGIGALYAQAERISQSESPNSRFTMTPDYEATPTSQWPSLERREAIRKLLTKRVTRLLRLNPRIGEWSEEKLIGMYKALQSAGFRNPVRAVTINPQLVTISKNRRDEIIEFLRTEMKIPDSIIFSDPILIGHYLQAVRGFIAALTPDELLELAQLDPFQKSLILKMIRAQDFGISYNGRFGAKMIESSAKHSRCVGWIRRVSELVPAKSPTPMGTKSPEPH